MSKRIIGKVKISADTARMWLTANWKILRLRLRTNFKRAYFRHLELPENMTDKEILDALPSALSKNAKNRL